MTDHSVTITPRKDEWAPVVEMFESAEYDTPEALARAIVKHVAAQLLERDWYLTVVKVGESAAGDPLQVVYGLSATERQAENALLGTVGQRMVLPVRSAVGHLRWAEEQGEAA